MVWFYLWVDTIKRWSGEVKCVQAIGKAAQPVMGSWQYMKALLCLLLATVSFLYVDGALRDSEVEILCSVDSKIWMIVIWRKSLSSNGLFKVN